VTGTPLATWDVHDTRWWDRFKERSTWLKEHGLPANEMYRCEFFLIDAPFARIFMYERNAQGRVLLMPDPGWSCWQPVCANPHDVPLDSLPPWELW
jgi:hypothetical protein